MQIDSVVNACLTSTATSRPIGPQIDFKLGKSAWLLSTSGCVNLIYRAIRMIYFWKLRRRDSSFRNRRIELADDTEGDLRTRGAATLEQSRFFFGGNRRGISEGASRPHENAGHYGAKRKNRPDRQADCDTAEQAAELIASLPRMKHQAGLPMLARKRETRRLIQVHSARSPSCGSF